MADMVEAAKARIADLEQEIAILRTFVESAAKVAGILGEFSGTVSMIVASSPPTTKAADPPVSRRGKRGDFPPNPPSAVVVEAAIQLLRDRRQPLNRREIREGLVGRGVVVNGTDPVKAMGTILWRASDRVKYVEGMGYWPVGDDLPTGLFLAMQ